MDFDELKNFIQDNYTDADKPKNFEPNTDVVQAQHDERVHQSYLNRLEKSGKNPIKIWYYLGLGKDKAENVICKNTPFDRNRKKAFYRWRKKIEKSGVNIRRPYFSDYNNHTCNYGLFKYYDYKYSNILNKIKYCLDYRPYCSIWDMSDIIEYLILKLTILGVYHGGGFSHILYSRQQMHSIWIARKLLIEAISSEDIYNYHKNLAFQKHFHINASYYDLLSNFDEKSFIEEGEFKESEKFNYVVSPFSKEIKELFDNNLFNTKSGRSLILEKCREMEAYWNNLDVSYNNQGFHYLSAFMNIKIRKAFEYISEHYFEWGD